LGKTKILYISHSPHLNGAEVCLLTLLKYLDRSVIEPVVVFPSDDGPLLGEMKTLGITSYICPLERWIRYPFDSSLKNSDLNQRVNQLVDIIEKESIQIVHTNTTVIFEGAVAAARKRVPHVWHVHESLERHPELTPLFPLPLLYSAMSILSARIVTVAKTVERHLSTIIDPAKLLTIYNGIDEKQFTLVPRPSVRSELGLAEDDILAVMVGALTERKGYPNLLRAASLVREHEPKIKFLWVGPASDDAIADFNLRIVESSLQDTVFHIGFRRDIPVIISDSDIFVLPSMNEAFPMVILEAMAAGKPVVATDCGGASESILDGETGFVVQVDDPKSLSEKILELAADKDKIKDMGRKSYLRFDDNFRAEIYTAKFMDLYRDVIDKPSIGILTEKEWVLFNCFLDAYKTLSDHILQVAEYRQEIALYAQQVQIRDYQIAERDSWVSDRDKWISEAKELITERERTLLGAYKDISALTDQIAALQNSQSWKITAPLRKMADFMKQAKRH